MGNVDFNKAEANKVDKAEWVKRHEHLREHEPDLEGAWESMQGEQKEAKHPEPAKSHKKK